MPSCAEVLIKAREQVDKINICIYIERERLLRLVLQFLPFECTSGVETKRDVLFMSYRNLYIYS